MKKIILLCMLGASGLQGFSQVNCGKVSSSVSEYEVKERTPLNFTANVSGGPDGITYNWSISAGMISSGQGTPSITVNTDGLGGQSITATVDIGGMDRSCSSMSSVTASVIPDPVQEKKTKVKAKKGKSKIVKVKTVKKKP